MMVLVLSVMLVIWLSSKVWTFLIILSGIAAMMIMIPGPVSPPPAPPTTSGSASTAALVHKFPVSRGLSESMRQFYEVVNTTTNCWLDIGIVYIYSVCIHSVQCGAILWCQRLDQHKEIKCSTFYQILCRVVET